MTHFDNFAVAPIIQMRVVINCDRQSLLLGMLIKKILRRPTRSSKQKKSEKEVLATFTLFVSYVNEKK